MPFSPEPTESILYPAPFVPTEHHRLVISNKRVVQFSPDAAANFPIAEFPMDKIEHVGRMSERPSATLGIIAAIIGVLFLIGFAVKVLPAVMYAGVPDKGSAATSDNPDDPESGIEGRDSNDENPFAEKDEEEKESVKEKADKKMKKLREVKFGIPPLNEDVVVGLFCLLGGVIALIVGRVSYNKQEHFIFCRVGEIVYRVQVETPIQQTSVLATIQAAQQAIRR